MIELPDRRPIRAGDVFQPRKARAYAIGFVLFVSAAWTFVFWGAS